jgi:hypothetical protein
LFFKKKVAVLKVLSSIFGITDQQVSFGRSCFAIMPCREKLILKIDGLSVDDVEKLSVILWNKANKPPKKKLLGI